MERISLSESRLRIKGERIDGTLVTKSTYLVSSIYLCYPVRPADPHYKQYEPTCMSTYSGICPSSSSPNPSPVICPSPVKPLV